MAERHIAAYFYPHDTEDPNRVIRAQKYGFFPIPNETRGSGRVLDPLGKIRSWTDRDPETVGLQMQDAKQHGIDTFLVCTYPGQSKGVNATEFQDATDVIADQAQKNDMNYGLMLSLKRPPNRIPYPVDGSLEPNRYFDFTEETLHTMVDFASRYWKSDKYLKLYGDMPFLMIYGLTPDVLAHFSLEKNINVGHLLQHYCQTKYNVKPYLVAVADSPDMAVELREQGFSATTSYAGLASFYEGALDSVFGATVNPANLPLSQNYDAQLLLQQRYTQTHLLRGGQRYYPGSVSGWNPILRCDPSVDGINFPPKYPYAPRILDSTPDKFLNMMLWTWLYYQRIIWNMYDQDEFPYIICSWNDIGDGTDILRKLHPDGLIDDGYLQVIKTFTNLVHSPVPLLIIKQLAQDGKVRQEMIDAAEKVLARKDFTAQNPITAFLRDN